MIASSMRKEMTDAVLERRSKLEQRKFLWTRGRASPAPAWRCFQLMSAWTFGPDRHEWPASRRSGGRTIK